MPPEVKIVEVIGPGGVRVTEVLIPGIRGLSAYEVAVANGFTGTEEEWLASLGSGGGGVEGLGGFVHTQASGSAAWIINHNLGRRPLISVLSPGGVEVEAEVVHVSINQAQVLFATPTTGSARLL
jgi:hypothetical protein